MKSIGLVHRIEEILSDGEWHTVLDVLLKSKDLIPPEVAMRTGMQESRRVAGSKTKKLNVGRRRVITKAIGQLVRRGRAETTRAGKTKGVTDKIILVRNCQNVAQIIQRT